MADKKFKKGDIIRIIESGDMFCDHRIDPKKQLWVVDEEGKSRPHGNTIYGLFTLDKAGELYESAAFPYAMELVEFPTSEEQEYAWHIKAALDKSREKIKLEDMTLSQIRGLKDDLRSKLNEVLNEFESKTGLHPTIKIEHDVTEIPLCMTAYNGIITETSDDCERLYERIIKIDFNKRI